MTEVRAGQSVTLTVQWYAAPGGPAADVTGLTITISPTGGGAAVVGPTAVDIVHEATGLYSYSWAVDAGADVGDYIALWEADGPIQSSEVVTVLSSYGTWYATEDELRAQFDDAAEQLPSALLQRALGATSRGIERFCGQRFWQDSSVQTRVYRPDLIDIAWTAPISTRTGLIIATDTGGDGTYATTWATTDYELQPLDADADGDAYAWWRIHAVDRYMFPTTGKAAPLQVTARFGWSEIPADVNQACIIRAAAIFKRKESVAGITGFDGFGAVRISRRRDPDVAELLDNFIRIGVRAV